MIAVERDQRALPALEDISKRYPGRLQIVCADAQDFDPATDARRHQSQDSSQPALQHRHRAADRLAFGRAVATLVRYDGADVSARGGRAHRCARERGSLWTPRGARELAHGNKDFVRHFSGRLRAATKSDLVGGATDAPPCPAALRSPCARAGRGGGFRPASKNAAAKPQSRSRSTRHGWLPPRMSIRPGAPRPFRSAASLPWPAN